MDRIKESKAANIESKDEDDETPFTLAVKNNHAEIVKMLLDKVENANPELPGKRGSFLKIESLIIKFF